MAVSPMLIKVAAALLTSEKGRKGVSFLLVAIFAPVILIAAILCSTTSGGADHNNLAVEASFYGVNFTDSVPAEFHRRDADRPERDMGHAMCLRWQARRDSEDNRSCRR